MEDTTRGLECFWGDLKEHPQCIHGPTLLFGKYVDGELQQFYACSACRDRKLCRFYLQHGQQLTKLQKSVWEREKKEFCLQYPHRKLFLQFDKLLNHTEDRSYCHQCEKLFNVSEENKHKDHEVTKGLTEYQMTHPTEILKPLNNAKKEAQYLFSKKSTKDIINMFLKLGAEQVLCIGTPRIHEYINEHHKDKISSLLLDIDGRFHNFFGPLSFCWYNLFNHHFFQEDARDVFKDFIIQNKGKNIYLICDPPFGGRVEPISQTIKTISDLHKKWNNINSSEHYLRIMFIFPYFMESIMREKSNPPSVSGGLKDLKMSDYKVDYDNHPLFAMEKLKNVQGSPVRIFTNIPLNLLELPESDGYKYCKKCNKWVSSENKHCKMCNECTSKDGRRYKHCSLCNRCVKPMWKHCNTCNRCCLERHICGQAPKVTGKCFKCNQFGHTEKDCKEESILNKSSKKRKNNCTNGLPNSKEQKTERLQKSGHRRKRL